MMNLYKAGEVDATFNHTVPAAWIDRIRGLQGLHGRAGEWRPSTTCSTRTQPPMNDVRVRKAFNMAIDKVALAEFRRTAKPLTGVRARTASFPATRARRATRSIPSGRKQLLAEAGYRDAGGEYDPSTFPVARGRAHLQHRREQPADRRVRSGAVEAEPRAHRAAQEHGVQDIPGRRARSCEYKGARARRAGSATTWIRTRSSISSSTDGGRQRHRLVGSELSCDCCDEANREPDPQKRYELLARAEALLLDAQPVIPLYTQATNWMKKPYVKGMYPNPVTLHAWKFVYIEHDPAKWD